MNSWSLPKTAIFGDVKYSLSTDYRDVLEIIGYLNDTTKPEFVRWQIAIGLFYDEKIPNEYQQEAMQFLSDFISYGATESKPGPKLIDWDQDSTMIISDVNKVSGKEIRSLEYLHWWTFLSYFYAIGEGQLSTVVAIRNKKIKGKKLEPWEKEFYSANRSLVDMNRQKNSGDQKEKQNILKWL